MKQLFPVLASTRKKFESILLTPIVHHDFVLCRQRHSLCALSSESAPLFTRFEDSLQQSEDALAPQRPPVDPGKARLHWDDRLNGPVLQNVTARTCIPFSSRKASYTSYLPHAQELLKGLWSLDSNPIWLLVDDLVAIGEPHDFLHTCPEFPRWKHIVMAPHYSAAISTLVAQGHVQEPYFAEDEEDELTRIRAAPTPTWLVAFMLATMLNTRTAAHEGVAFCLSQLDTTPRRLRISLLLLSMCSLATHGLAVQVPVLLDCFHDVFFHNQEPLGIGEKADSSYSLGSRETVIYQYNILLTLLSQFPHVPGFAPRIGRLLQHMETCGVPIDADTANQLISARFATEPLVCMIQDIIERQATYYGSEQSDDLSVALTRFYSKRNKEEAAKYADISRPIHPGKHAQVYLRSFRDTALALAYLRTIEEREHDRDALDLMRGEGGHDTGANGVSSMSSIGQTDRTSPPSPKAVSSGMPKRHIYTSLLHSAAVSKNISATTFRNLFNSIRGAHGDDTVLETVALSGMLQRKAWDEAKSLWAEWQTTYQTLQSQLQETQSYLERREKTFGDAKEVRRALGWSKLKEDRRWRIMKRMKVDSIALSVAVRALAGPEPASLLNAFIVMDDFALKFKDNKQSAFTHLNVSDLQPTDKALSDQHIVNRVRLTSRVINCFMVRAMYFRRPDVVFRLWGEMTGYYGVDSSVATLDILLRSARLAVSMESALNKVIPHWMTKGFSRTFLRGKVAFPNFSAEMRWMLGPDCSPDMSWHDTSAWRVVRFLFREEILFTNWPSLEHVDIPAQAVRGDEATGRIEALRQLTTGQGLWGTKAKEMGNYPHLVPSPRTFREYVLLLGRVQRTSEIPEVLAWMKALDVRPSRKMLSICLALWSQVGLDSLVDDAWTGMRPKNPYDHHGYSSNLPSPSHGGEYSKLIIWLEEWLGREGVPGEGETLEAFKYIQELEKKEAILY